MFVILLSPSLHAALKCKLHDTEILSVLFTSISSTPRIFPDRYLSNEGRKRGEMDQVKEKCSEQTTDLISALRGEQEICSDQENQESVVQREIQDMLFKPM